MPADRLGLSAAGAPSFPFAEETPPRVAALLAEAGAAYRDEQRAEALLRAAQHADPQSLPAWFALYKFYFYRHRLPEAERVALEALAVAAAQGGFDADWTRLHCRSADWAAATGPARFYLFSLKALAFIRLRLDRAAESAALLAKLAELDPADRVGGSVIRSLAAPDR
jgi:tetratricopeptide (TPR) repeat protein